MGKGCVSSIPELSVVIIRWLLKVSRGAKIRNRYNQVPHLTQDTNGKVINSQLDTTNESQEVSSFPEGDHKAQIKRRAQRHCIRKTEKHKRFTKEVQPWSGRLNILLEGLNRFYGAPTSPLIQMWIKTNRYFGCIKDLYFTNASSPRTYKSRYNKEIKQR